MTTSETRSTVCQTAAEICRDDTFIILDFAWRSATDGHAVIEHDNLFTDLHDQWHVMFNQQHSNLKSIADLLD